MARWWTRSSPNSTLDAIQSADLDEYDSGHSNQLTIDTILRLTEVEGPQKARERLRKLRRINAGHGSTTEVGLPPWINDLPNLETIDLRGRRVTSMAPVTGRRLGLDAETIVDFGVNPSSVAALDIDLNRSRQTLDGLLAIARFGKLSPVEMKMRHSGRPEARAANDQPSEWLGRFIDLLISTQPNLVSLVITGYPYGGVPPAIAGLASLTHLWLTEMELETIPSWLFELPLLHTVGLPRNKLAELPRSVRNARNLQTLQLSLNRFTRIPDDIWSLTSIVTLGLNGIPAPEIPREIRNLRHLATLEIGRNGVLLPASGRASAELVVPPPEVTRGGLDAVRRYWQQNEEFGVDYLAEAKLLIVGEAGAGKTSLSKKILDPSYRLNETEVSTEGIDVRAWNFLSGLRVRDGESERILEREFRVNVWDFGGQEIYHSTHQFFLTKRSVYVLVCDERKEDTDFQYWLDVINLLSGGSPLIIVQNRKQGRAQALNVAGLRQAYPQLVGAISLNLADNDGLDEAVAKIRKEVESLPHIGTSLPKTWRDVRVQLEGDPRDYISAEEFFRICRENGFTRDDDIRQLGGFLHDLGICLFFQDDDLLRKTVILKPEWGTGAVYRVLDDDTVITNLGVFGKDDLLRIWPEDTFAGMHAELVQLMVKFALCFPVESMPRKYVAPQLLSPEQPGHHWDDSDNLLLRYDYDVMPKGVVRRLIVALHDLIEEPLVWRTGVVLKRETARVEIIEEYHRRRLRIRLMGDDPRVLLAMIDRELTLIHQSYPDIKFSKLRPCNCPRCATSDDPAMFLISDLEDFARTGDHIQCRVSRKLLDPVPLLAELSPDPAWRSASLPVDEPPPAPEVFVSYKWGGDAETLVQDLQARLQQAGVSVVRDKTDMVYRQSIREFMRRIGAGKAVIVVLDRGYLESENCMFELTEIAARPEFRDRVFPVVLPGAGIYQALDRLAYIEYWEQQKTHLEQAMRRVGQENLQGIRDDLDLYERIRNTMAGLLDVLRDMNTPNQDPDQLARAIEERLDRD